MALCEQCGSIQIVRARPRLADRLVALLTSKRPFICRRCRWRGRRGWTDQDLLNLSNYGAGGAEPDPALAALDPANAAANQPDVAKDSRSIPSRASTGRRRSSRSRRKRSRRREIIATVAVIALVMFFAVMLGLTGSCGGGGADAL